MAKKKSSKNLVPIGTHVPMTTKMAIEALAESQEKSVYELLQGVITELAEDYEAELEKLKDKKDTTGTTESVDDGEDLLS